MGRRCWRHYRTQSGACPTLDFISAQPPSVIAEIVAAMNRVKRDGLSVARKLRGDIWEVRIMYDTNIYRLLFAPIGSHSHILLALECFQKKTQKTPPAKIDLAEARLADWLQRGT
ncbi:MAG TPA: type II toxin-antitoxin system RelE/ParE family toxin [Ktedonobacteraceae bacterium]